MSIRNIYYKLNNESQKTFFVFDANSIDTYFIIRDFNNFDENKIIDLLLKKRKIIISDLAIISMEKVRRIFGYFKSQKEYLKNFYISKECYILFQFHNLYFNLLKEFEISNMIQIDDLIRSDALVNTAIKIKFFSSPSYLLKCLDSSIYLKKLSIEKFNDFKLVLVQEFNEFVEFYKIIHKNLIVSTSIFLERKASQSEIVCNVVDNLAYSELITFDCNKIIGVVSAIDEDLDGIALLSKFEKGVIGIDKDKHVCWLDLVDIKNKVKKFNIDTLYIDNLHLYGGLNTIKVCCEYGFNKFRTKHPQYVDQCDSIFPLYYKFNGWTKNILNVTKYEELPEEFILFLKKIKKTINVKSLVAKLNFIEVNI